MKRQNAAALALRERSARRKSGAEPARRATPGGDVRASARLWHDPCFLALS